MRITAIFITLLYILVPSTEYEDIEFSHKKIDKVITRVIKSEDFKLIEVESNRYISEGGNILGKYFSLDSESKNATLAYIGRVFTCPHGDCTGYEDISETIEYYDYLILFDESPRVVHVSIFNYQATRGHGIIAKGWLKQFIGYDGRSELRVGKNIDAISGATKSVSSIVKDVMLRTNSIEEITEN